MKWAAQALIFYICGQMLSGNAVAQCVITATNPCSDVHAIATTGSNARTAVRDEVFGVQLVRKGGLYNAGDGPVGRLLLKPAELLNAFVPRPNLGYPQTYVATPQSSTVYVNEPFPVAPQQIVVQQVPTGAPQIVIQPSPTTIPLPNPQQQNAVVVQTIDVQTLLEELCKSTGNCPGVPKPRVAPVGC